MAKKGEKKKRKSVSELTKDLTRLSVVNEDMNRRKTKGGREVKKIYKKDTIGYQHDVERVHKLIIDGVSVQEIYVDFLMEDGTATMSVDQFTQLVKDAYDYAENSVHKDREFVFQLHMDRYEKMYEKSIEMVGLDHRTLDHKVNSQDWIVMCAKYNQAMKMLRSKEDLIGLHDKSIVLEFRDNTALVAVVEDERGMAGDVPGYKLDNLTLEEQIQMLKLIQQVRTIPVEGEQRVIVKTTTIEMSTGNRMPVEQSTNKIVTQDIEFEEMPENVVSKMENILPPRPEQIYSNEIDDRPEELKNAPKVNKEDIEKKVNKTLVDQFKQRMKRK